MQRLSQQFLTRAPLIIVLLLIVGLPVILAQTSPSVSINNVIADEGDIGDTIFSFTVTRAGDLTGTVTVDYETMISSFFPATPGVDYVETSGTLTFLDGENEQPIEITVNGDTDIEPDEFFEVHLSNPQHESGSITVTLGDSVGQGVIQNDDPPIILSRTTVNVTEGGATAVVTFTLRREPEPSESFIVNLTVPNGQCSVLPTSITLTDANWEDGENVTIRAVDDSDDEGPHTCIIEVFLAPDNINPFATIQGNITDNDGTPPDDDDDGGTSPSPTPIDVSDNTATPTTPTPIIRTSTPAPTATSAVPSMARVSGEVQGLALRTGPYLGATLIGSADAGFEYPILARNHDEGGEYTWFLIQVGEVQGWVSGRFLNFIGLEELLPVQGSIFDQVDGAPDIGVFGTTFSINDLRRRPSGRAGIITQIPANTRVSIIGRTRQNGGDFWYQVRYNGLVGWIPAFVDRGDTSRVPIR